MKLKKNDEVLVLAGRDKGKKGKIVKVLPKENRVVVEGINMVKRHEKASATSQGGMVSKELSMHASNVSLIDPKSGKATRVGYKIDKDGSKTRIARRSGETLTA